MDLWFYFVNGGKYGPIDDAQLRMLVGCGVIVPQTPLETAKGNCGLASQVQGLFTTVSALAVARDTSGTMSLDAWKGAKPAERRVLENNGIKYCFRWCPAGRFTMGSPSSEAGFDDERQHEVTLTRGFWMLETEVTQRMWKSVMGNNPSKFEGDDLPVERVSWEDCQEYIAKLNRFRACPGGYRFSLPTEAQWEYACRAGTTGPYGGSGTLATMGLYIGNSGRKTHEVKTKSPNAWGLYDMHGNVAEWCLDWCEYVSSGPATDPTGPAKGSFRVIRGGCWCDDAKGCRSADRSRDDPTSRNLIVGFRLAVVPDK